MKVVIIGGVAGGASAAARLRRLDEEAQIVMIERGGYISYANCGLPYYIGGDITEKENLTLQTPQSFRRRFGVEVRIHSEVTSIDTHAKLITVRNTLDGTSYHESYDTLLLSPGAKPVIPPIPGVDNPRVFTLRTIPDTLRIRSYIDEHAPKKAVVIGGGYIGVEMAENLTKAGLEVTIVEASDHIIGPLDYDMACEAQRYLRSQGVRLLTGQTVTAFDDSETGLSIGLSNGQRLSADMALLSVGVRPETELAQNAGIRCNAKGSIVVDKRMRTSARDVYAVGDAVEVTHVVTGQKAFLPLAGPANKQGRIAADNICGLTSRYTGSQGSSILKLFDMTIASTGINERAAIDAGIDYDKVFTFSPSHATYYPGAANLTIKTLFESSTGKILGAQVVGFDGVDKRCDVLATAIRAGMTAYDLTELELCYAPPYSSAKDPVNMTGYMIENLLTGKVRQFHWHDIPSLPRDGSVTLLDVRTPEEYARGHIDGFCNIPLDELRRRIEELDPTKTVYVHCQSGLRSYIACRMLMQKGYFCYNFAGSYRLYESVLENGAYDATPAHPCGVQV